MHLQVHIEILKFLVTGTEIETNLAVKISFIIKMTNFKENIHLLFLSRLFIIFLFNIIQEKRYIYLFNFENYISFISIFLGGLFFFYVSKIINHTFKLDSFSLSLCYFLLSFFIFDSLLLPITKFINFQTSIYIVSIVWVLILSYLNRNIFLLIKIVISYIGWRIFNFIYFDKLTDLSKFQEFSTDVPVQWEPIAKLIYENNYFYGIENNLIEGQGLVGSYVQSLILNIGFYVDKFTFIQVTSNLFILFGLFLIYDLNLSKKNKLIYSIFFISLLLNNVWLKYLMINSLMIEGIVSFLLGVFLLNLKKYISVNNFKSSIFFLFFGSLTLTKNFGSLLILLIVFVALMFYKKNKGFISGIIVYGFYLIYQKIYFSNLQSVAYTNEIDFRSLIIDILLLRNLDLSNVLNIIKQIYIDKPLTYIFVIFAISNLYSLIKLNNFQLFDWILFSFVILNYLLVNLLYISYWQNIEFESSYRYIVVCLHIIIVSISFQLSKIEKHI